MKLRIKRLTAGAIIPSYATDGAACFDIHVPANVSHSAAIAPGDVVTIMTGLALEVPRGHVMLVFSRSGHGFRSGIRLSNCTGVIDSDYRGELMVQLRSDEAVDPIPSFGASKDQTEYLVIRPGDRIAQAMVVPIPSVEFEVVEQLSATARGAGGLGSTGA